jgi:hypothetical protein
MLLGKCDFQTTKKKNEMPGRLQTVVRGGDAPQMVAFSNCRI